MIYTHNTIREKDGTERPETVKEALQSAALAVADTRGWRRPQNYLLNMSSNDPLKRAYRTLRDRLGDVYRVFRVEHRERGRYNGETLRRLRAERGVGRQRVSIIPEQLVAPPAALVELLKTFKEPTLVERIRAHLAAPGATQRKVAEALGISLGKLQRELKKAQAQPVLA